MSVIAHVEFRGIQSYIFGGGRLLDAIGRSALVESLTDPVEDPLNALLSRHPTVRLQRRAGSFTAVADDARELRSFLAAYSRRVSEISDAIRLIAALDDQQSGAATALRNARLTGAASVAGYPLLGARRVAGSAFTAEKVLRNPDGDEIAVSRDIGYARDRGREWHEGLQNRLREFAPELSLPTQIDLVAPQRGVSSKIAMIVMDVNGLGGRLEKLARTSAGAIDEVSDLLRQVNSGLLEHLMRVSSYGVNVAGPTLEGAPERLALPLEGDDGSPVLPFRPLVSGGDDLVIVCESRLAWSLAHAAMDHLSGSAELLVGDPRQTLRDHSSGLFRTADGRLDLSIGIGIAVVPSGYSLLRAHELAETVCRTAKRWRRTHGFEGHVVDWHFGTTPPSRSSEERRYGWSVADAAFDPSLPWRSLMALLNPATTAGIRSVSQGSGSAAWTEKRSWIKGDLLESVKAAETDPAADGGEVQELIHAKGLAWPAGIGLPTLDSGKGLRVLRDAIDLLDEHLALGAASTTADDPAATDEEGSRG